MVHSEIGGRDSKKTQDFYSSLFDWKLAPMGPAVMIDTGETVSGHFTSLGHEPHHYTVFYVQVDDVPAHLDKAKVLGGAMLVPPVDIPSGKFAWMQDAEGNTVGLFKTANKLRMLTARSRNELSDYQTRSKIPAAPMPPPTHMVTMP